MFRIQVCSFGLGADTESAMITTPFQPPSLSVYCIVWYVGDMSSDAGPSDLWFSSGSAQQTAWGAHRSSQWWSTGDFQWWWVWWQWWRYRITVMIRKAINTKRFWWNPDFADWAWGQHPNGIGYKVSALSSSSRSQIPGIVKLPHDPLPIISRGTLCSVQCAKSSKK